MAKLKKSQNRGGVMAKLKKISNSRGGLWLSQKKKFAAPKAPRKKN